MFQILSFTLIPTLYSIRASPTFQSAVSYPLPPPSTIKGMIANALQRFQNKSPTECVRFVEENVLMCSSTFLNSVGVSSTNILRQVVWDEKAKEFRTDALAREFIHAQKIYCVLVLKNYSITKLIAEALRNTPIYLGDSESLVTIDEIKIDENYKCLNFNPDENVEFNVYAPMDFFKEIYDDITLMWFPEKIIEGKDLPLTLYVLPLKIEKSVYRPLKTIKAKVKEAVLLIESFSFRLILRHPKYVKN